MRLLLVGVYSDGSNARSMLEDPLLEYDDAGMDADEFEDVIKTVTAARKALRKSNGSYGDYLIVLEPDDE